jgi:hypothetical protein
MNPGSVAPWSADWAWGLPLIVLTAVLHAYGLELLNNEVAARLSTKEERWHHLSVSSALVGGLRFPPPCYTALRALYGQLLTVSLGHRRTKSLQCFTR